MTQIYIFLSVVIFITSINVLKFGFDYLKPFYVFCIPWYIILLFSISEISEYSRELGKHTYFIIIVSILIASITSLVRSQSSEYQFKKLAKIKKNNITYAILVFIYILLTLFNIFYAGYIPLVNGITTGKTSYLDFGLSGIYGFYNAYSNALGILSFYLYLQHKDKKFLATYCCITVFFILFVTRQNVISLLVESLIVYSFLRGRVSKKSILTFSMVLLILFSISGGLRSGDIKTISKIKNEYMWIPEPLIWLYSYSYFNLLNLDRIIYDSSAPFNDYSSLSTFIPRIIRPDFEHDTTLEVSNFTVSSYASILYLDMGSIWVFIFTFFYIFVSEYVYKLAQKKQNFVSISTFSVMYFCCLTSFFSNHWFYLPVIFQIFFFVVFKKLKLAA